MEDRDISPTEFHKELQKVEKYRKPKADIRNHLRHELLHPTECDFMVYKGYKNWAKTYLANM